MAGNFHQWLAWARLLQILGIVLISSALISFWQLTGAVWALGISAVLLAGSATVLFSGSAQRFLPVGVFEGRE